MKKLLIFLLFLGFSFGQEKTLVGLWECISCPETYKLILKEDGAGIISIFQEDEERIETRRIKWETFVIENYNENEKGVLIFDSIDKSDIVEFDYLYTGSSVITGEMIEILVQMSSSVEKKYNGNDILHLVDISVVLEKQ